MKTTTHNIFIFVLSLAYVWTDRHPNFAQAPPAAAPAKTLTLEDYRNYALTHEGSVTNGARLFADEQRLACAKCHTLDGRGGKAGPDLYAIGDKFARRDLIDAILLPSAQIAVGYTTTIVETKAGAEYTGIIKQSNNDGIQIIGADGKLVSIASGDIRQQRGATTSLMPDGLQASLSLQEFADLTDYLVTLRQPENTLASNRAMPGNIPQLVRFVGARRFFDQNFQVPAGKVQTGLTAVHQVPGRTNLFLILHQKGMIWMMDKAAKGEVRTVFADLTQEVFSDRGPNGLLGLAFHPKCLENRKYYLKYQVLEAGKVTTVLMEKEFAPDFKQDSGLAPRRLLQIESVAEDHSGGCIQFGPDGYLYFGMGDTGPQQDPNGHSQNLGLLLGKMLRLDVDHPENGKPYAIPSDNPFRGRPGARPEIWACGFRNPWRFSFDRVTGDLWLGDVGQDRVEEIDIVRRGENYGWNVYEAFEPFSNQYRKEGEKYTPPIFAYKRKYGNSVTGGYVYRGDKKSSFYGVYVFGDYTSKIIFGLTQENGVLKTVRQIASLPQRVVSFGTDEPGNIYALGYEGKVYLLDFTMSDFNNVKLE